MIGEDYRTRINTGSIRETLRKVNFFKDGKGKGDLATVYAYISFNFFFKLIYGTKSKNNITY